MHSAICVYQEPQYCLMVLRLHTWAHTWNVDVWLQYCIDSAVSRGPQVTNVPAGTCSVHTDHAQAVPSFTYPRS